MKIKTASPKELQSRNPEAWELMSSREILGAIPGIGPKKIESVYATVKTAGDLAELARQKKLSGYFGAVVIERIVASLQKHGLAVENPRKRSTFKGDLRDVAILWLSKEMGVQRVVDAQTEISAGGFSVRVDKIVELADGTKVAVMIKNTLHRGTFFETFLTMKLAVEAGLADRYLILAANSSGAYATKLTGDIELRFMDES